MSALVISGHQSGAGQCPLCPQKRTSIDVSGTSALCQKRTHALQQNGFYSIIWSAPREQGRPQLEAKRGRQVDDSLENASVAELVGRPV
jgi:hypothetical protein